MSNIVNPYIAGNPVTVSEMFFGRDDVFQFIRQTLIGKHQDNVIVLYGQRRTGKTSILYQMRSHLDARYLCIFVDLHGLALEGLGGFLWELANHIRRVLQRDYQINLPSLNQATFVTDPRNSFESDFLEHVRSAIGNRHILLMLDEAIRLLEQVQAGRLEHEIFVYMRHLMQHYDWLDFLFSLGSGLEEMEEEYSLLFNVGLYKKISFLDRSTTNDLVTQPVKDCYQVDANALERIFQITSGHPYYTQLLCHCLFNRWQQQRLSYIKIRDVDEVLDEVVERGLSVLKHVWEESTASEKAVMAAMAAAMGDQRHPVEVNDINRAWAVCDVAIPKGEIAKAIRSLIAREVITGQDKYVFAVYLQQLWVQKYRRLEWVKEEIADSARVWSHQTASPPVLPPPNQPTIPSKHRGLSRRIASILIGFALIVVIGSTGFFYWLMSNRQIAPTVHPVPGGIWIDDLSQEPDSLLPNTSNELIASIVDQAIWAPLFYGDASGILHPGLAKEIPTIANGDVSADLMRWTFKLRPGLKWSDGQPLDARDVDFTWRLWNNPNFLSTSTAGINLITSVDVTPDNLAITFYLSQGFEPFLSVWADGILAPLPAHHYRSFAPQQILKSTEKLNPSVTSGPFMMKESKPGDHYTVVRNPNYYRASEGLPYLNSIVFQIVTDQDTILNNLLSGTVDSAWSLDVTKTFAYQKLSNYTLFSNAKSANFEAFYFNFHNKILGTDVAVRQAMAMAVDHQALINGARRGQAISLCTDHGPALNPGYQKNAPCPKFDVTAANTLLDQDGWTKKDADGYRSKGGQKLEFKYSTTTNLLWRTDDEAILQMDFQKIGIKIDIQNYDSTTFFNTILPKGKPGMYDIAEFENTFFYDADDAGSFACNNFPPYGFNFSFYCNRQLDRLFVQEEQTADPVKRQQIFNQIHQIYLTDFPFVTLYEPIDLSIHKNIVNNYYPSPAGPQEDNNIWEWWCKDGNC